MVRAFLVWASVVLALWLLAVPSVRAQGGQYATRADALAACNAYASEWNASYYNPNNGTPPASCHDLNWAPPGGAYGAWFGSGYPGLPGQFIFAEEGPSPGETCSGRPEIVLATDAGTTYSNAGCVYAPYGDANRTVCLMADGSQSYCSGAVHMRPTGDYTSNTPPTNADPVPAPPKVCGGGSCYDPSSGQYCAVGSGGQVCVSINNATHSGCATSGDTTLCAGYLPPIPPKISVPDPATAIASHDTYADTSGTGSSSSTSVVTVNNYNTGGTTPNSGAGSGDVGPGNSDNGSNVSVSGGGDCGSPPIVSGDPASQAIAYQAWATRCAIQNQGQGLGTGQVGNLHNLYTPSTDTVASVVSDFQSSVQTTPIGNAVSGFFKVNGVGGSCPVWTVPASDYLPAMTFDFYCRPELSDLLDMARLVILIACAYAAFRIAFGDA